MKKLGIIAAVLLLTLYGCYQVVMPSATLRYRLTLRVADNGKIVEGSSVVKVYRQDTTKVFGGSFGGHGYDFKGEAVAVDLGKKGILFALLKGDEVRNPEHYNASLPPYIVEYAFESQLSGDDPVEHLKVLKRKKPKADLPPKLIPMLVHFKDINDPKTIERVDPNNLAKSFGPGVKLVGATIEVTSDRVTKQISRKIPWFNTKPVGSGYYNPANPGPENYLTKSDFIME